MGRRAGNTSGIRELMIACREYRLPGCPPAPRWSALRGGHDELLRELKAGGSVEVSAADVMLALSHGGEECRQFAFGGRYWGAWLMLDDRGELAELPPDVLLSDVLLSDVLLSDEG